MRWKRSYGPTSCRVGGSSGPVLTGLTGLLVAIRSRLLMAVLSAATVDVLLGLLRRPGRPCNTARRKLGPPSVANALDLTDHPRSRSPRPARLHQGMPLGGTWACIVLLQVAFILMCTYGVFGINIPREAMCTLDGIPTSAQVTGNTPVINHERLHYQYEVEGKLYEGVGPGTEPLGSTIPIYYSRTRPDISCQDHPQDRLRAYVVEFLLSSMIGLTFLFLSDADLRTAVKRLPTAIRRRNSGGPRRSHLSSRRTRRRSVAGQARS